MYFDLTDDQKAIAHTVATLLAKSVPASKVVEQFDHAALDGLLWNQLAEMGLGGILVPQEHGGIGMDLLTLAAVQEEIGRAAAPVPVANNAVAAWVIGAAGSEAQRERWIGPLLSGETIAAFALDAGGRTEPAGWSMDTASLSGAHGHILWATQAGLFIVGTKEGGLALVEAGTPGLGVEAIDAVDRSQPMGRVTFEGVAGEALPDGAEHSTRLCDALFILSAADACGAGNRAMDLSVDYAQTRKQFDRLIGSFQGLKHQLANMKAEMEPVRCLYWYAAHCWDAIPDRASYTASLAKAHAGDIAVKVARAAVEAHGGIGYSWEYPLHIYLKRAMTARAIHGLPSAHRARSAQLAGW
jgi:alkylation response protein AidB-like acyl-CoA dehydrogenase